MTMRPLLRGYAWCILCIAAISLNTTEVWAQEARRGGIRPSVDIVFSTVDDAVLDDAQTSAVRLLQSTVEGRLRTQRRYEIARFTGGMAPEEYIESLREVPAPLADVTVFLTVTSRRDRGLGIEVDVWDGERFRWSGVESLPTDTGRFVVADDIARMVSREVAALFPGFARLRFTNTGRRSDYYVYVDDSPLGTNIGEIELPVGAYEIDVRVRDEQFEYTVGRRQVTLRPDDFIDIRFTVEDLPRPSDDASRPADERRTAAIFDLEAAYAVPSTGLSMFRNADAVLVTARALFADAFVSGLVLGAEAGIAYGDTTFPRSGVEFDIEYDLARFMGTAGLVLGPSSGVDFMVRASGGATFVTSEVENTALDVFDEETGWHPAFGFSTEFGFGFFEAVRVSLRTSWFAFVDEDSVRSWSMVGIGFGTRY